MLEGHRWLQGCQRPTPRRLTPQRSKQLTHPNIRDHEGQRFRYVPYAAGRIHNKHTDSFKHAGRLRGTNSMDIISLSQLFLYRCCRLPLKRECGELVMQLRGMDKTVRTSRNSSWHAVLKCNAIARCAPKRYHALVPGNRSCRSAVEEQKAHACA